ncbi:hypothetical protein MMC25_008082 [Agyrium rufum]|nr:hypothetical protein [Agyrium rufum]
MDTSYLTTQVATIIGQLHNLFDEIGVANHDRESRETELFTALSETLHGHLKLVTSEKTGLAEEANRIIKTIKQMESSLEDPKPNNDYQAEDPGLQVTVPLTQCLKGLREKYNTIARIHRDRFEQVKKLVIALDSYSSHLEPSFVQIPLPPTSSDSVPPNFDLSPSYVTKLDNEFTRIYEEFNHRIGAVKSMAEEVVNLWAELGTPQAQTDSLIINNYRETPEQLGLHENDLQRLKQKRDKLVDEKRARERRLKELKVNVEGLWDRLGIEETERRRFLAGNRGCGMRAINEFDAELARLNELKRQNLHLFVEDARCKLQELWDNLYFSEEEMLEFTPAFSDVYSDALLSAHESEISRLESLKEQRLPTLQMIDRHRSLIKDREDLTASSQDASRLMLRGQKGEKRDPGKLLREEKMRKRITKELPKVEADLRKTLEDWEDEYGRAFLVHGQRYLDELDAAASAAKVLPPRSKTPNGLAPAAKSAPKASAAPPPSHSRSGSVIQGGATSRAGPTPSGNTLRRNPLATSTSTTGTTSPSKIPSRVPLSSMKNGNNSPERRTAPNHAYDSNTVRKMGPPARAPPPKMRDLFVPPTAALPSTSSYDNENWRTTSISSSDGGVVHVSAQEDPYIEYKSHPSSRSQSNTSCQHTTQHHSREIPSFQPTSAPRYEDDRSYQRYQQAYQPTSTDLRQISTSTSNTTLASGSENWETYDDASEPETDANDAYYAKLKASRGKRITPDGGYTPPGKKVRALFGGGGQERAGAGAPCSEASWQDEEAF